MTSQKNHFCLVNRKQHKEAGKNKRSIAITIIFVVNCVT